MSGKGGEGMMLKQRCFCVMRGNVVLEGSSKGVKLRVDDM